MVIDQLPVNTPNGIAGLDKDGKVSAAQLPVNTPNGIAGLGDDGKIAAAQLPSYVDDVVEGYYHEGAFYSDPAHREQITPESGKVYMDAETNITYRWSGHSYAPIGSDLALGETQSTAYRGDRGKIAYDHSMTKAGNPHGTKAADIGYTDNKGLGAKNLQGAMDAAAQRAIDAQKSADAALDAITKIGHTIDAVPSQNGTLTYTGSEQSPTWNSYNPETMTMGGVTKGTDAGSYNATFTPKEGYTWGDGTNETKTVVWKIGRATIMAVPSQSGALAYTGSAQTPAWANYESTKLTLGGTTSGTNAGSYEATFTPKANYQWQDGSTTAKTAVWRIERAKIAVVPSQSGALTYTGGAQSPSWSNYDSTKLTLGRHYQRNCRGQLQRDIYAERKLPVAGWKCGRQKCGVGHSKGGRHAGPLPHLHDPGRLHKEQEHHCDQEQHGGGLGHRIAQRRGGSEREREHGHGDCH